jgi:hypothetical protein
MALFQQDFIMRQIQYLTQLLQQIIFKKNQNKDQEAVKEIQNAFQRLTKEHPKEFRELNLKETLDIFIRNTNFESELALAVADLLVEEGEILRDKHFSKAQKCHLQALLLYKKASQDEDSAVPLDINEKIKHLEKQLKHVDQTDNINRIIAI